MSTLDIVRHADANALAEATAARLVAAVVEAQTARGSAHVCLTGGRIGTAVLSSIAASSGRDSIDWSAVDLWWGDERFADPGDPERNDTGADDVLLRAVGATRVNRIPGPTESGDDVDRAAELYADVLAAAARPEDHARVPAFDVLLLSIGPDGHVASLFPELPALHDERPVVAVRGAPKPPPTRVTLTLPALNCARQSWVLASGAEKATAVRMALSSGAGSLQVPAAGVRARERTMWLVDDAAAALLPPDVGRPGA
jgi:6-phosphogluconolactonase